MVERKSARRGGSRRSLRSRAASYHQGLLRLHAPDDVADAYDAFVAAATDEAGPQRTAAITQPPTRTDADVPLGSGYNRHRADRAKAAVLKEKRRSPEHMWWQCGR